MNNANKDIKNTPATALLILMCLLGGLAESIYAPALSHVSEGLNISESMAQFTITIYLIAFAISQLPYGIYSEKYGRRNTFLFGTSLYVLGTLLCCLSEHYHLFILGRFLQGLGGSAGSVLVRSIIMDKNDPKYQRKQAALILAALSLTPLLGPIIGGGNLHYLDWKHIFPILLIFSIFVWIAVFAYLPETRLNKNNDKDKDKDKDKDNGPDHNAGHFDWKTTNLSRWG